MELEITREVKASVQVVFDTIIDIEKYPEFLPRISAMQVKSRTSGALEAVMSFAALGKKWRFPCFVEWSQDKTVTVVMRPTGAVPVKSFTATFTIVEKTAGTCEVVFKSVMQLKGLFYLIPRRAFLSIGEETASVMKIEAEAREKRSKA